MSKKKIAIETKKEKNVVVHGGPGKLRAHRARGL